MSNVAKAAFGDGTSQAQQWTQRQIELLWHERVEDVVTALQVLNWDQITCLEDIRNSPSYFETRKHNMDYARLRREGYPIGSGTVEGGINTVVHHRMKRQGRGWKRQHAQAMMAALGELHGDRFQLAWQATCDLNISCRDFCAIPIIAKKSLTTQWNDRISAWQPLLPN